MEDKTLNLMACASGVGGADVHSGDGPLALRHSEYLNKLIDSGVKIKWGDIFQLREQAGLRRDEMIGSVCASLAKAVSKHMTKQQRLCVLGGDHSCAVGTWSGVYDAIHQKGDLGLVWIDAHMDSHTPETSETGHIHGMPLAALLGYGYPALTSVLHYEAKLKPENICLIGIRSFEEGEAELLKKLNVRVYLMEEVNQRGFTSVLKEAIEKVKKHTYAFGISLDIDAIDPEDAPAVDVPEEKGIHLDALQEGWAAVINDKKLVATEIVEFNPLKDKNQRTEKLIVSLLEMLAK